MVELVLREDDREDGVRPRRSLVHVRGGHGSETERLQCYSAAVRLPHSHEHQELPNKK